MKPTALLSILALAGCAASGPPGHGPAAGAGSHADMMKAMCRHRAAEPGMAASAPGMMAAHCKASADEPAAAASHGH